MKKLFLLPVLAIAFAFVSCQKETVPEAPATTTEKALPPGFENFGMGLWSSMRATTAQILPGVKVSYGAAYQFYVLEGLVSDPNYRWIVYLTTGGTDQVTSLSPSVLSASVITDTELETSVIKLQVLNSSYRGTVYLNFIPSGGPGTGHTFRIPVNVVAP